MGIRCGNFRVVAKFARGSSLEESDMKTTEKAEPRRNKRLPRRRSLRIRFPDLTHKSSTDRTQGNVSDGRLARRPCQSLEKLSGPRFSRLSPCAFWIPRNHAPAPRWTGFHKCPSNHHSPPRIHTPQQWGRSATFLQYKTA